MAYTNKPFIIPVFLPHAGCPHRCVFCNQATITGRHKTLSGQDVRRQIDTFLGFKRNRGGRVQIAFFGGNFLGIQKDTIKGLLTEAAEYVSANGVDSIRFSTRPDTVDRQRLALIKNFPVATIELGVQSMNDRVLKCSHRGHSAADTVKAVQMLKEHEYEAGVQLMVGLPDDNAERALASARQAACLRPDFVRIYPTVVLAGSPLAAKYKKGDYAPLSLAEAVRQVKDLYLLFKKESIPVIRMGLQANEDFAGDTAILAGPYHPAFGHLVYSEVFLDKAIVALESKHSLRNPVALSVHPRNISKMRGLTNKNIHALKQRFKLKSLAILPDDSLGEAELRVRELIAGPAR